jgi:hypothetical protein
VQQEDVGRRGSGCRPPGPRILSLLHTVWRRSLNRCGTPQEARAVLPCAPGAWITLVVRTPRIMLWIGGTKVSDVGLHKLAAIPVLKEVFARNTQVTPEGARHFRELLPDCAVFV